MDSMSMDTTLFQQLQQHLHPSPSSTVLKTTTVSATKSVVLSAPATPTLAVTNNSGHSKSLSGGVIAGIVIGISILFIAVAVGIWLLLRRKKRQSVPPPPPPPAHTVIPISGKTIRAIVSDKLQRLSQLPAKDQPEAIFRNTTGRTSGAGTPAEFSPTMHRSAASSYVESPSELPSPILPPLESSSVELPASEVLSAQNNHKVIETLEYGPRNKLLEEIDGITEEEDGPAVMHSNPPYISGLPNC
jgi:hypothetical protein